MKNLYLILFCLVVTFSNVLGQAKTSTETGATAIDECGVRFKLAVDFEKIEVRGIDSCVLKYKNNSSILMLDVLGYITPNASRRDEYSDEKNYKYRRTTIQKRKAEIFTFEETQNRENSSFPYVAVLFVPQMSREGGNLTIWINSTSENERTAAMKIFQTVRF